MNVQQMHLAVQQGVDKINSLQADTLLREEIDIELNKAVSKYINTRYGKNNIYRKGFEESQKRIDDLRNLVTEFEGTATFKEQLTTNIFVDTFSLPSNYMYLVSQLSKVVSRKNCKSINYHLDSINTQALKPYFAIGLSEFVCNDNSQIADSLVLYEDINDTTTGQVTIWSNTNNYQFPQDIGQLITNVVANPPAGIEIYWEQFNTLHFPGQFIVLINTDVISWFEWDASVGTVSTLAALDSTSTVLKTATGNNATLDYNEKRVSSHHPSGTITNTVSNTFVQHDDVFTLLHDPFNTTKKTDPLTTIRGNNIDIYTNDIFIIDAVKITYIRNPKKISLSLGIDCELPDHTHQTIVDMAVSSILEGISDPRYQTHEAEVGKNE
tara:strand:- start:20 stop:1165 length:1146 start_codon:yes stop_codon:yes gene_type:complete